jgi:Tfp pilus assembly protein PilV
MIRTIPTRLKRHTQRLSLEVVDLARALGARAARCSVSSPLSEEGDTLIEVIISAALIAFVVIAILTGLDSANRSTSLQRARSQADALAQQDEDELRAEPVNKISELKRERTVEEGKTKFTIVSTSEYKVDTTDTASCTSSTPKADYLETVSRVTSPVLGNSGEVVETGIISPPADSAVIVQVQESGTALAGAKVVASGPAPATTAYELETSSNGCAIIAVPTGGEYSLNVSKSGYVDPNGYANTNEDLSVTRSIYLPDETTSKEGYNLGRAGKLEVGFTGATPAEGDSFVAFNTGMSAFREFGTAGTTGKTTVESPSPNSIFPFTTPYTVYAGTCEADLPTKNGQSSNPEVSVAPGATAKVNVPLGAIGIKVLESNKGFPEKALQNATVRLEDTGCGTVREFKTTSAGALPRPGMPFGNYSLCVTGTVAGKSRKYTTPVADNKAGGVTEPTIYLGEEGKPEAGCP